MVKSAWLSLRLHAFNEEMTFLSGQWQLLGQCKSTELGLSYIR